jgi:hypothetical protein
MEQIEKEVELTEQLTANMGFKKYIADISSKKSIKGKRMI